MQEIAAGLFHWTAVHPKIHVPVHSYYWAPAGVLIDPLLPRAGLDAFRGREPAHVLLTNRHHYRHSDRFEAAFGCGVWCHADGLGEFTSGEQVGGFRPGDELPGGIAAHAVGHLCPDETALWLPVDQGALAVADGVIRDTDGLLGFVPDELIGEDPEAVKRALKRAYAGLCELDFAHLLLAHGAPLLGGGRELLRAFCAS